MATVSELKRERRLPDAEMDQVIARAARLQDEARAQQGLTVAEVRQVGHELDIDARFVDAAINQLDRERADADRARGRARSRRWKLLATAAGAIALVFALAWSGAAGV